MTSACATVQRFGFLNKWTLAPVIRVFAHRARKRDAALDHVAD